MSELVYMESEKTAVISDPFYRENRFIAFKKTSTYVDVKRNVEVYYLSFIVIL